jgi:hypothetical protein
MPDSAGLNWAAHKNEMAIQIFGPDAKGPFQKKHAMPCMMFFIESMLTHLRQTWSKSFKKRRAAMNSKRAAVLESMSSMSFAHKSRTSLNLFDRG